MGHEEQKRDSQDAAMVSVEQHPEDTTETANHKTGLAQTFHVFSREDLLHVCTNLAAIFATLTAIISLSKQWILVAVLVFITAALYAATIVFKFDVRHRVWLYLGILLLTAILTYGGYRLVVHDAIEKEIAGIEQQKTPSSSALPTPVFQSTPQQHLIPPGIKRPAPLPSSTLQVDSDTTQGEISGSVMDEATNDGIPDVDIVIRNTQTKEEYRKTSGDYGGFRLFNLPPGHYTLTFTHKLYKTDTTSCIINKGTPQCVFMAGDNTRLRRKTQ